MNELMEILRLDLFAKLVVAVFVGGAIGFEREVQGKPAGLRTNILICMGSTLLMDLGIRIAAISGGDPVRIAAQVVTGIGFLGAGTILHTRGMITGLTSAATIWVVAAIGLAIGAGFFVEALGTTLLVIIVLIGLGWVEKRYLEGARDQRNGVPPGEWDTSEPGRRVTDRRGLRPDESVVGETPRGGAAVIGDTPRGGDAVTR